MPETDPPKAAGAPSPPSPDGAPARPPDGPIHAPSLVDRLKERITPAHLQQAFRAGVAAVITYGLAYALDLPKGYWAVLTAILVMQSSLGASLSAAFDRTAGTVVGGALGVALAVAAGPSVGLTFAAVFAGVFLTSTLAARYPSFKLAPVTAVIVLLSDPTHAEPVISGLQRVFEIALGGVVGLACALVIFPSRALAYLFPNAASTLRICARLMEMGTDGLMGRGVASAEMDALNTQARAALRGADARIAESRTELAGRLASHADPGPVVRTCRRVWHSVIILLRGAATPLPADVAQAVGPVFEAATAAIAQDMRDMAQDMAGGPRAGRPKAPAAVTALENEVERLTDGGVLDHASGRTLTAVFGAVWACIHVSQNLEELRERLAEMRASEA